MYGTVAKLKIKPRQFEALQKTMAQVDDTLPDGYSATYVYQMKPIRMRPSW